MKVVSAVILGILLCTMLCWAQSPSDPKALYEEAMNALTGAGLSHSELRGVDLMQRSAEMGYGPAQTALGYMYESGSAVPQNVSRGAEWYRKAALDGEVIAQWALGRILYTGAPGVLRDAGEAEKWLTQAAQQNDPFAEHLLGVLKEERDYTAAPEWFRKAAEQGLPQAERKLGIALKNGRGIAEDKKEAYVWLLMSLNAGISASTTEVSWLESELGSNVVQELKSVERRRRVSRSSVAHGCTGWPGEYENIPSTPPLSLHRYCR